MNAEKSTSACSTMVLTEEYTVIQELNVGDEVEYESEKMIVKGVWMRRK